MKIFKAYPDSSSQVKSKEELIHLFVDSLSDEQLDRLIDYLVEALKVKDTASKQF